MPFFGARSYMNIDMGLYVKFNVTPGDEEGFGQGRPTGCRGLNRNDWLENLGFRSGKVDNTPISSYDPSNYLEFTSYPAVDNELAHTRYSDVVVRRNDSVIERFSGCHLNDDVVENGEKMNEIFETFANDNQLWVNEFVAVFQKMLENGYQAGSEQGKRNGELKVSEIPWKEIICINGGDKCTIVKTL